MKDKIKNYFDNKEFFTSEEEIEKDLTELVGCRVRCYDTKIDDGVDVEDSEDEYVMLSAFEFDNSNIIVRVYYGNNSREIGYVSIN